ncbi:EAL domain-containing protein [Massilia sp. Bi118]|uniref:EAL domain-containing protein n=1 Tax=Massilia sp. Bi118 TaxID=2822346 RepID=UPI0035ABD989
MLEDLNAEKLTQAIVAMGNALKINIVAEGVETREQMNWLLAHGCHIGQGSLQPAGAARGCAPGDRADRVAVDGLRRRLRFCGRIPILGSWRRNRRSCSRYRGRRRPGGYS